MHLELLRWIEELVPVGSVWPDSGSLMSKLIEVAAANVSHGGGPFASALVRGTRTKAGVEPPYTVVIPAVNLVEILNDPTAHAEMMNLRLGGQAQGSWDLANGVEERAAWDLVLFTTGEPCIMCTGALLQSRGIVDIHWAASSEDIVEHAGFFEGPPEELELARSMLNRAFRVTPRVCNAAACQALATFKASGRRAYTGLPLDANSD